ncbi:hypothetical protein HPB51_026343 [Rhipicephalus microplus]|uniref:Tick transposon n=1 Tax=Rhipicephalus microplus TaxID=6941 RepID=A0A9J6D3B1_RHIMP|nr:hypothetical protein HPB51_026343 [Rhipicephalus microplus]
MGEPLQIYQAAVDWCLHDPSSPANKKKTLAINTGLGGLSKRGSPICTLKRASASKIEEELAGRLIVYTDGSVIPDTGSATASCVMAALVWTASCHLLFAACSTAAETAGLHMAVDLLAANSPTCPVGGRVRLKNCVAGLGRAGTGRLRNTGTLHQTACPPCQWRRCFSALGPISCGNPEETSRLVVALAKEAYRSAIPVCRTVVASDFSRLTLRRLLLSCHPDYRVARMKPTNRLPHRGFTRRERSLLLNLHVGCS